MYRWIAIKQLSTCKITARISKAGPLGQSLSVKLLLNLLGTPAGGSITPRYTFQLKVEKLVRAGECHMTFSSLLPDHHDGHGLALRKFIF